MGKSWSKDDEMYLQDNWGNKSINAISRHLNRSYLTVRRKAINLGLLKPTLHYDGITVKQLSATLGISNNTARTWIEKYDFPAKSKVFTKKQRVYVVSYDAFWVWAEKYQHLINFSKLEPLILGKEPDWVKKKRKVDTKDFRERRPWSDSDICRLLNLVNCYHYTYPEIASKLKRSEPAVRRKLWELDVKARPLSLNKSLKYTDEEVNDILRLLKEGYNLNAIANFLNDDRPRSLHKSASGIKFKLERMGYNFHRDKPLVINEKERQNC